MAETPYADHIRRSLELLSQQSPWHRQRLAEVLDGRTIAVVMDDELIQLALDGEPAAPALLIAASGRAALSLLRGRYTLEHALWEGAIEARGAVAELLVGAQALHVYLHGLIRCPGAAALITELASTVDALPEPTRPPGVHARSESWDLLP